MKTQTQDSSMVLKLILLFLILLLPGIVFSETQKFPNFLKIAMNPDGSPKPLSPAHQKWLEAQSLKQYKNLKAVSNKTNSTEQKRSALINQLNSSSENCDVLKKFESSLTDTDIQECREFYAGLVTELRQQIMSYGPQELDDAIHLSLFALEKMKNGEALNPEEQIEQYVQTESFKNQLAELPEEMQKEIQLMMKLSKDPQYRKAIETGEEATLERILKENGLEINKNTP